MATETGKQSSCGRCRLCSPEKFAGNSDDGWNCRRPHSERARYPGTSRNQRRLAAIERLAEETE